MKIWTCEFSRSLNTDLQIRRFKMADAGSKSPRDNPFVTNLVLYKRSLVSFVTDIKSVKSLEDLCVPNFKKIVRKGKVYVSKG